MEKTRKLIGDLYRLLFADGKSYIGARLGSAKGRYLAHKRAARKGSISRVHVAWRKLGDPILIILKKDLEEKKLWKAEKKAIAKYNTVTPNGYNGHKGSDSPPGMFGKPGAFLGKHFTEEHKKNIGEAQIGKKLTDETKEKLRQAHLGKPSPLKGKKINRTLEQKEQNRLAHLGFKHTEKTKQKMSVNRSGEKNAFYGKKHTQASISKMIQSRTGVPSPLKGKKHNQDHRKKNSQAHIGKPSPMKGKHFSGKALENIRQARELRRQREQIAKTNKS